MHDIPMSFFNKKQSQGRFLALLPFSSLGFFVLSKELVFICYLYLLPRLFFLSSLFFALSLTLSLFFPPPGETGTPRLVPFWAFFACFLALISLISFALCFAFFLADILPSPHSQQTSSPISAPQSLHFFLKKA